LYEFYATRCFGVVGAGDVLAFDERCRDKNLGARSKIQVRIPTYLKISYSLIFLPLFTPGLLASTIRLISMIIPSRERPARISKVKTLKAYYALPKVLKVS